MTFWKQMRTPRIRLLVCRARAWAVMMVVGMTGFTAMTSAQSPVDPVAGAKSAVRAFFPELLGQDYQMLIYKSQSIDRNWNGPMFFEFFGVEIEHRPDDLALETQGDQFDQHLLTADFSFRSDSSFMSANFRGRANSWSQYRRFVSLVSEHKEWTDEEVLRRLEGDGALFVPARNDEFTRVMPPLERLVGLFGGMVRVQSTKFLVREKDIPRAAQLEWEVIWSLSRPPNSAVTFRATFEPFTGKATHVGRVTALEH